MAELILRLEGKEIARLRLADRDVCIGRAASNDLVIIHPKASRLHARVLAGDDGSYDLEDAGSANGCFVGSQRLTRHRLVEGEIVLIGGHELVYFGGDAPAPALAPAPASAVASHPASTPPWIHAQEGTYLSEPADLARSVVMDVGAMGVGAVDMAAIGRSAERLQALFEITKILDQAKDFNAVLVQILDRAISIMRAERGFLMLADAATGELRVHVARDLNGDITAVERETMSRSLMRRVVESGKPMLVLDALRGDWRTASVAENSITSALCVPLMSRDVVAGVLYVDHRQRPNAFTNQDLAFFTTFAIQAKSAIDSSRAYWELVESLFRASGDFIVVCSPEGNVQQANRAAAELLGVSLEQLRGRALADLVSVAHRELASALVTETIAQGVVSARELDLLGPGCVAIPFSLSSFALCDRTGRPIGMCVIGRDLSEIQALVAKLSEANKFVRKVFGRYLSDEVVTNLLAAPEGLDLGGVKRKVTILMSDLRGFTSIAERIPPEQVVALLNGYLGTMVEVITRHRGTIDEFIGDAILVIFGAPIQRPDDAMRAAACAIEMQLAMGEVNAWCREHALPEVEMGIAINTGDVVVGNIGSQTRSKYAVVGRHVNLASRIESYTVGGQILIAGETRAALGEAARLGERLELRLKGVKGLFTAFDLQGLGGDYDLRLPTVTDELSALAQPRALRFAEIESKHVGDTLFDAEMVRLGKRTAEIRAARHPEPLSNLNLVFAVDGVALNDAFAKVIERTSEADPACFRVRFTWVPPEVERLFASLRA